MGSSLSFAPLVSLLAFLRADRTALVSGNRIMGQCRLLLLAVAMTAAYVCIAPAAEADVISNSSLTLVDDSNNTTANSSGLTFSMVDGATAVISSSSTTQSISVAGKVTTVPTANYDLGSAVGSTTVTVTYSTADGMWHGVTTSNEAVAFDTLDMNVAAGSPPRPLGVVAFNPDGVIVTASNSNPTWVGRNLAEVRFGDGGTNNGGGSLNAVFKTTSAVPELETSILSLLAVGAMGGLALIKRLRARQA